MSTDGSGLQQNSDCIRPQHTRNRWQTKAIGKLNQSIRLSFDLRPLGGPADVEDSCSGSTRPPRGKHTERKRERERERERVTEPWHINFVSHFEVQVGFTFYRFCVLFLLLMFCCKKLILSSFEDRHSGRAPDVAKLLCRRGKVMPELFTSTGTSIWRNVS